MKCKNPTLTLNGQQYEITEQFRAGCGCCNMTHDIILLSRDFAFTVGGFGYRVKHECFYCSVTSELFVDKETKDRNQQAINDVVFPHRRGVSINP